MCAPPFSKKKMPPLLLPGNNGGRSKEGRMTRSCDVMPRPYTSIKSLPALVVRNVLEKTGVHTSRLIEKWPDVGSLSSGRNFSLSRC